MSFRPAFALLIACLALAAVVPSATAHGAAPPPGFKKMLHDCADDWGSHGGLGTQPGQDLVGLWLIEDEIDGTPMVVLQVTLAAGGGADGGDRVELHFDSAGRVQVSTTIRTTGENDFAHVSGLEPAHVSSTRHTAYKDSAAGGGSDSSRHNLEIGYSYEQLQAANGDELTGLEAIGWYKPLTADWTKGDHLAGGKYQGGQYQAGCEDSPSPPYAKVAAHKVAKSDWSPPSGSGRQGTTLTADFTFTPETPATGEPVSFQDRSSGPSSSWHWSFGDGATSTEQHPTHAYEQDGNHKVRLTVTDANGNEANVEKNVLVLNRRPVADFTWEPAEPHAGAEMRFESTATDPDGEVVDWQWDFGDDTTAAVEHPMHTYQTPGGHTVRLTVTDEEGASHTTTKTVSVHAGDEHEDAPAPAALLVLAGITIALLMHRRD